MISEFEQPGKHAPPDTLRSPTAETAVDRGPLAEPFRNVTPGSASADGPQDAADDGPVVEVRTATPIEGGEEWCEAGPLRVGEFFAAQLVRVAALDEPLPLAYTT